MAKKQSALVLLSGGLDSTYNLYRAVDCFDVRLVLTFDYGQRAAGREIAAAERVCGHLLVKQKTLKIDWFKEFTDTALVGGIDVPTGDQVVVDSIEVSQRTAKAVWVPNRNGIFLNIAAGFAEGLGADYVIPGFNAEEAVTFSDNSQQFLDALDVSFKFSTMGRVHPFCFSTNLDKTGIVNELLKLRAPFENLWPCYHGDEEWCGACESCLRFRRALEANTVSFDKLKSLAKDL